MKNKKQNNMPPMPFPGMGGPASQQTASQLFGARSNTIMRDVGAGAARAAAQMGRNRGPRGPRGAMGKRAPKGLLQNGKKSFVRLLGYAFKPYWWQWILVVACIILSAYTSARSSVFLGEIIDDHIIPMTGVSNPVFSGLAKAIGNITIIYAISIVTNYLHSILMVIIGQGSIRDIRNEMFAHMQTLPIRYYDTHAYGDVMSYYTNDVDTLSQMISRAIPQMISSVATIVIVFTQMLRLSFWLTLGALVFVGIMLVLTKRFGGRSATYFVMNQRSVASVNGFIEEIITGQKVVKVFNREDTAKEEFDFRNEELRRNATAANVNANILMPILGNLGNLQYICLAIFGGILAVNNVGGITIGIIVSFLTLSRSFSMPIQQVSQQVNSIIMALAGAERIFTLLDEESEQDEGFVTLVNAKYNNDGEIVESNERTGMWAWKYPHENGKATYTKLEGNVTFTDVDFAYNPDKQVLFDISLYAKPGQKVAFVGATGAGKTTITNLINRFYDIADGKVRYDGININKIKKSDLRRSLSVVLQDVNLFTGTVRENIRYGRLDATDEEIEYAAKLANADGFIRMLPQGYDTELEGDGSSLSQGQRQLISIARAAVADPPVMILDEATSSIDTRTEFLVQSGMDKLMNGRTVFVIAHRLSTVQNSDVIMVLELGHIIERGTHEQLIDQHGTYYQLYTGAFELE